MKPWPMVPLGEVAELVRRPVEVEIDGLYPELGVRSFGRGTFHKPPLTGADAGSKRLFRIEAGDLVFNIVFAWEGAVAVAGPEDHGRFGSHRFLTFVSDRMRAEAEFIKAWFSTPSGLDSLGRASPGGAGRNRTLSVEGAKRMAVPLPPLDVQRRIVKRLDAVEERVADITSLRDEIRSDLSELVTSANSEFGGELIRLGDALVLEEDRVPIASGRGYPQVGIRGFGGGLFAKPPVGAGDTTYRHFNRLHDGHFVMSQVKGWEGAVAVCDAAFAGMYASPEYRTFRCVPARLRPVYFSHLCATPWFHQQLAQLTRGQGARRERLRPEMLLDLHVPLPDVETQARLEASFSRILHIGRAHDAGDLDRLLPALLAEAFGSA
jgi:type I restriction enzyme S subunit